ncbi:MAG: glutathione S-transferase family protein [Alphaproteobacteria bacterium]|nr:glutathione S-transferase family protein [Alphaproteobacteria bacterium]MBM3625355.1 glutathione S-transferase family protein [Alphaproteobacteria bacterium]MBM3652626.1 glutathione S-transferase family protein [Alphaproteobacteria bacterium]
MTITLYCFRPAAGLPDASPFVTKAMLLLKIAGLDYVEDRGGFSKAPKGKQPYIDDDGDIVADSTFIRFHIEQKYGADFDAHLSETQKAVGWCVEKMCEEHLYWIIVRMRWMDDANFERGPARFFESAPAIVRPLAKWFIRRRIAKSLWAQGMGRHGAAEIDALGKRDVEALSTLIGDKPYLFGDAPCAADATVFAFVASVLSPMAESAVRDAALSKPNLVAYRDRIMQSYFPQTARS